MPGAGLAFGHGIADRGPGKAKLIIDLIHHGAVGIAENDPLAIVVQFAPVGSEYDMLGQVESPRIPFGVGIARALANDNVAACRQSRAFVERIEDAVAKRPAGHVYGLPAGIVQFHVFHQFGLHIRIRMDLIEYDFRAACVTAQQSAKHHQNRECKSVWTNISGLEHAYFLSSQRYFGSFGQYTRRQTPNLHLYYNT